MTTQRILVVEDGASEREALARMLRHEGFEVPTARNVDEALQRIDEPIDIVISDLRLGGQTGIDLLRCWRKRHTQTPFVLLTAYGAVDSAVSAMKMGASDFLAKPVDPLQLLQLIRQLLEENEADPPPRPAIDHGVRMERIVGRSQIMSDVCERTLRAARTNSTVLLLGESGTGKELFAEAIHYNSPRAAGPFVVVNMAAIPDALVESELFGHAKGSFTGAHVDRIGRFEAAGGGTLFIDEIGDFPLRLQAKLLRVLENLTITPVGSGELRLIDVRVVTATSRPLARMKSNGEFREDLYYRLNVISLELPPLRERRQDIPLLVRHFLAEFARSAGRMPLTVTPELMHVLEQLDWQGNVRELRNCIERMSVMARGDTLVVDDLPTDLQPAANELTALESTSRMESLKRSAMLQALDKFAGNRTKAAEFLGISVRTLQRKLREWKISETT